MSHNQNPERLLNHTWKIEISRDKNNFPADRDEQLLPGDRIKIIRHEDSDQVHLVIWAEQEKLIYVLKGTLEEYELKEHENVTNTEIYSKAVIRFIDTIGGGNQVRILKIFAARLSEGTAFLQNNCGSHINEISHNEQFGDFLSVPEVQSACETKELIVWKIEDEVTDPQLGENKPESGQGTASGGG